MAQPKKRTSKSKKNSRKSNWKNNINKTTKQALSLAKSIIYSKNKRTSFIYNVYSEE